MIQLVGCDVVQAFRDEGRDGIGMEGDVFGRDESLLSAIGGFVPLWSGGRDDGYILFIEKPSAVGT